MIIIVYMKIIVNIICGQWHEWYFAMEITVANLIPKKDINLAGSSSRVSRMHTILCA